MASDSDTPVSAGPTARADQTPPPPPAVVVGCFAGDLPAVLGRPAAGFRGPADRPWPVTTRGG